MLNVINSSLKTAHSIKVSTIVPIPKVKTEIGNYVVAVFIDLKKAFETIHS